MHFYEHWQSKGHVFGTCMSHKDSDLMYVNIPKNASSWTKPNLLDLGWEFYNYHRDNLYHKQALVVLRDPVERWLSGICEYFTLYHSNTDATQINQLTIDLIMDQIAFDDHTERQVYFIELLDPQRCIFFNCNHDYRLHFGQFLKNLGVDNKYHKYNYQHTTENREDGDMTRSNYKKIFQPLLENSKYLDRIKLHYKKDYDLINSIQFYHG